MPGAHLESAENREATSYHRGKRVKTRPLSAVGWVVQIPPEWGNLGITWEIKHLHDG